MINFLSVSFGCESFLNKLFSPFLVILKATDIHFVDVSERTQPVLGEFYEPVFCEFSVLTLYTGLLVCQCS